jgi:hypothetical protein
MPPKGRRFFEWSHQLVVGVVCIEGAIGSVAIALDKYLADFHLKKSLDNLPADLGSADPQPPAEQLPLVDLSPNDRRFVCCLGFASNAQLDAKEGRVGPS